MNSESNMIGLVTSIPERVRVSLQHDTHFLDSATYKQAYALNELHWGIQSPAFVLYENFFPNHPYPSILPKKTESGLYIGVNSEILPDKRYRNYLSSHEWWEHYIRTRPEGNLLAEDERDYGLPILQRKRPAHRFAVLREFQLAQNEGTLSQYMDWWRKFYLNDKERITRLPEAEIINFLANYGPSSTRDTIITFIQQNLQLREDVFQTVLHGTLNR